MTAALVAASGARRRAGGSGGAFTPADLADIVGWYRGDDALESSGDITWTNRIPATSEMLENNDGGATLVTIGGQPAVNLGSGATQTGGQQSLWIGATEWHVFFVCMFSDLPYLASASPWLNHRIVGDVEGWWGIYADADGVYGYVWDTAARRTTSTPIDVDDPLLIEFWKEDGVDEIHIGVNDASIVTLSGTGSNLNIGNGGASNIVIGHTEGPAIGEYTLAPTYDLTNVAAARAYFAARYGMSV